jgi:DNA-directed RNA polymerase specialized sigma24 family protein
MATVARTPDAELLLRLRSRDREAWEELYAEYQPRLRAFGYRLAGNVHDADDLVQETFVRTVPRLDRLDPGNYASRFARRIGPATSGSRQASRGGMSHPTRRRPR